MPEISEELHIAMSTAYHRVDRQARRVVREFTTLLVTRENKAISLSSLAHTLHVSIDIATKLEQHSIKASSIPQVVFNYLAEALQQPQDAIRAYFEIDYRPSVVQSKIAETKMPYHIDEAVNEHIQSFRQAVEESSQLSEEQKDAWYEVLNREDL